MSVTTYYVENTIEERLLSYRQVTGEDLTGANSSGIPSADSRLVGAPGMETDATAESQKEAALAVPVGLGVGIGGSDAQGLTAAKLRCVFGLTDDADAARAEEQARIDAVIEARERQAAVEAEAAEAEAAEAAMADVEHDEEYEDDDFGNWGGLAGASVGGLAATATNSDDDGSDVDLDDY